MLSNKWSHGSTHFILPPLPPQFQTAQGIVPWRLGLDPKTGSEMVLLLIDRTPFIYDLAKIKPFDFRLNIGLVRTSHGPLCFLLFYVPDPTRPGSVYLAIDAHLNPFDADHVMVWRDLARQSHWHLVLVGVDDELVDLFEFENIFNLGQTLDQVETVCSTMDGGGSIDAAKFEFAATYPIERLLEM
jgi:hypothetical protein